MANDSWPHPLGKQALESRRDPGAGEVPLPRKPSGAQDAQILDLRRRLLF